MLNIDKFIKLEKNINCYLCIISLGFGFSLSFSFVLGYLIGNKISYQEAFNRAYIKASDDYYLKQIKYINIIENLSLKPHITEPLNKTKYTEPLYETNQIKAINETNQTVL
jgi:hypothetical protein